MSILISYAKLISEIDYVDAVACFSAPDSEIVCVFGEVNPFHLSSCEEIRKKKIEKRKITIDCSTCKLCGNFGYANFLPLSFGEECDFLVIFTRSEMGKIDFEILECLECSGKLLSVVMGAISMREKVREAKEVIDQNIAHFEYLIDKIRNPLAAIVGYLEIKDDIGHERAFEGIRLQAERITRVMDSLRERERITYGLKKRLKEGI